MYSNTPVPGAISQIEQISGKLTVIIVCACLWPWINVRVSIISNVFLDLDSWICKIMLRSRVMPIVFCLELQAF